MEPKSFDARSSPGMQNGLAGPDPRLLSVEDARSRIIAAMPLLSALRVDLSSALGRALAEDILARTAHPPTTVSAMDGYALRSADVVASGQTEDDRRL